MTSDLHGNRNAHGCARWEAVNVVPVCACVDTHLKDFTGYFWFNVIVGGFPMLVRLNRNDRYPLSPRIVALKEILGQLRPEPARPEPLPARRHYVTSLYAELMAKNRTDKFLHLLTARVVVSAKSWGGGA
jgi:hypothetical protein